MVAPLKKTKYTVNNYDPNNQATWKTMVFPRTSYFNAVKPKDKGQAEKLGTAIGKMVAKTPLSS